MTATAQKITLGSCTTRDGGEYSGEMASGKPHGKGKTTWKNGNLYEGEYAKDTAMFAATLIDANMVDEYLRIKDSAEGYNRIKRYYSLILNSSDRIQYLYVYQIQEDGCHVVFDTDTPDTPGSQTGEVIPFDEGFLKYKDDLLAGKEIPLIESNDSYGWLLSSYVPIYNNMGKCKAYVCVDVSMPNIADVERTFTFKITTIVSDEKIRRRNLFRRFKKDVLPPDRPPVGARDVDVVQVCLRESDSFYYVAV